VLALVATAAAAATTDNRRQRRFNNSAASVAMAFGAAQDEYMRTRGVDGQR
jgi:hypothetical protein